MYPPVHCLRRCLKRRGGSPGTHRRFCIRPNGAGVSPRDTVHRILFRVSAKTPGILLGMSPSGGVRVDRRCIRGDRPSSVDRPKKTRPALPRERPIASLVPPCGGIGFHVADHVGDGNRRSHADHQVNVVFDPAGREEVAFSFPQNAADVGVEVGSPIVANPRRAILRAEHGMDQDLCERLRHGGSHGGPVGAKNQRNLRFPGLPPWAVYGGPVGAKNRRFPSTNPAFER